MLYKTRRNAKKNTDTITISKEEKVTNRDKKCWMIENHYDCMECVKLISTPYTCYCEEGYKTRWELMR